MNIWPPVEDNNYSMDVPSCLADYSVNSSRKLVHSQSLPVHITNISAPSSSIPASIPNSHVNAPYENQVPNTNPSTKSPNFSVNSPNFPVHSQQLSVDSSRYFEHEQYPDYNFDVQVQSAHVNIDSTRMSDDFSQYDVIGHIPTRHLSDLSNPTLFVPNRTADQVYNTVEMVNQTETAPVPYVPPQSPVLCKSYFQNKWSDLLAPCPTIQVEAFGSVHDAIVDSGAESSIIPYSVYSRFPPLELYSIQIQLKGANDQCIPVMGFVCIPVTIHDHVVEKACFFVKSEEKDVLTQDTILLGNNILRKLPETCPLYELTQVNNTCPARVSQMSSPASQLTGLWEVRVSKPVTLKSGKVHKVPCVLDGADLQLAQAFIYWEGKPLQIIIFGGKQVAREFDGKSSPGLYVQDGYLEKPELGKLTLLVGNLSRGDVILKPGTSIAIASNEPPREEIFIRETDDALEVSIHQVIGHAPDANDVNSPESNMTNNSQTLDDDNLQSVHKFMNGHQYILPPGLVLPASLTPEKLDEFVKVIEVNDEAFSKADMDVGECGIVKHVINLTDNKHVNLPYRKIPPHHIEEVRKLLQDMIDRGIIRKSFSPYASPLVLVRKKSGKLRPCVDYKEVNARTVPDAFPLPRIDDMLQSLKGSTLFSSLDLTHGYFQIMMDEMSIPFTAFRVPWGLYEFLRVPQGMRNSPSTFARAMEAIFSDMNMMEILLYLDDILIFSDSFEDHLGRIQRVLERLVENNLKVSPKKCHWLRERVTYLGYTISNQGISTDPDKVKVIVEWPLPQKCEQLASFMGLAGFYRRFIKNFSAVAKPLQELTNGDPSTTITWDEKCIETFGLLKTLISSAPVLAHPDFRREFIVEIDASFRGLGACLSQMGDDGNLHPIAFASRAAKGSETRYQSSFKLELAALRWAVAVKFREYLICSKATVYTDCNALLYLRTAKLGAVEQRWVSQLAPFNLNIVYRPGKANRVADALSRHPDLPPVQIQEPEVVSISHIAGSSEVDIPVQNQHDDVDPTNVQSEVPNADPNTAELVAGHSKLFPTLANKQLRSYQRSDLALMEIEERVRTPNEIKVGPMPNEFAGWAKYLHDYVIIDELLYRKVDTPMGQRHLLLVPSALRLHVLEAAHDFWAHQGRDRTMSIVESRCFWPGLAKTVKEYIKSCARCLLSKPALPVSHTPRRHLYASSPLEIVSIDFLKMDQGKGGYEDILVCTDVFTKFAVAVPCRDQTALTTAKTLKRRFIDVYGAPVRIHSDQGRNFESKIISELCGLYNISKSRTTPYNPSGNPITERFNRTLCGLLRSLDNKRDWPDEIQNMVFIFNCTPHSVTKISPYKLFFGRDPTTQLDQLLGVPPTPIQSDFVAEQQRSLKRAHDLALKRIEKSLDSEKRRFDTKRMAKPLEVGSKVLLRRYHFEGRHKLVDRYYSTSFVVVERNVFNDLYLIRLADGSSPTAKWVNRKSLIADNRRLADEASDSADSEDEFFCPFDDIEMAVEPPPVREDVLESDPEEQEGSELEKLVRRSSRPRRGIHGNPNRELRSAWEEVGKHKR